MAFQGNFYTVIYNSIYTVYIVFLTFIYGLNSSNIYTFYIIFQQIKFVIIY